VECTGTPRPSCIPATFVDSQGNTVALAPNWPAQIPHEHAVYIIGLQASSESADNGYNWTGDV